VALKPLPSRMILLVRILMVRSIFFVKMYFPPPVAFTPELMGATPEKLISIVFCALTIW
jgi:hypothetical protein